jgi:integrase
MAFSAKIVMRRPARRDGTCQIRLQVVLNSKPVPVGLNVNWPPELFDEEKGQCLAVVPKAKRLSSYSADLAAAQAWAGGGAALEKRANDYNLIISEALAKASNVFVEYRLSRAPLTAAKFLEEYNTEGSKSDFITYFYNKILERHRRGKISDITRKNHLSSWRALKAFRDSIPFYSLSPEFADDYKAYLDKKVKSLNTRWGRHKDVKTYLAQARLDKIKFENPYEGFRNQDEPGKWRPVPPAELRQLEAYYHLCAPGTSHRRILCKFLFSCKSSLRLGDLKNMASSKLAGNELTFEMQKGWSKSLQATMLPLTRQALRYLADAQEEEGLGGFYDYTDQYENRILTAIGRQLGLSARMHHHAGRETFATEFIRADGKVEVLQKLMNHSKIATTMKYVHVDDEMKRAAINALDQAEF